MREEKEERSILISIHPKWVRKILSGEKLHEIRKTHPKEEVFLVRPKVYIYETGGVGIVGYAILEDMTFLQADIDADGCRHLYNTVGIQCCLTDEELFRYLYDEKNRKKSSGWAWRLQMVEVFPHPVPLAEIGLERPPQSWMYLPEKMIGEKILAHRNNE